MTSIADTSVKIQTTSESNPSTPCWFGEVVAISSFLRKHHILSKINERVHFARKRFGRYEVIDFLAVLFGYAVSSERTLEEFYESLQPFAIPFMALFERDRLPSRSALSRFLAALTEAPVEALRTLFLDDLLARPLTPDKQTGGLVDRKGDTWTVFDIDGTREAARQRAGRYLAAHQLSPERTLLRLDGQYGNGAVLADVAGFAFVTRGKDYHLLDHPSVSARLHLPPDQVQQRPESQAARSLYDCPEIPAGPDGAPCRVVVATHLAGKKKSPIGVTRAGVVYELFFTNLPQQTFTARDVVELYLHRGAFEPVLSDEDQEIDPDRWCSHSAWGQECWQTVSQWVWNLRLELGHHLHPDPVRTTEFAPALPPSPPHRAPAAGYAPPEGGSAWKAGRFAGQDFAFQSDGTLRCPANQKLTPHEQRREADGSLRVVYGASIRSCRPCPLREQCQWQGSATAKPRQVSVLLHPLVIGQEPLLWQDWSRRVHRRACMQLVRYQQVEVSMPLPAAVSPRETEMILSRAQRAHSRLPWAERLARNARVPTASQVAIRLFGIPEGFANSLDWAMI